MGPTPRRSPAAPVLSLALCPFGAPPGGERFRPHLTLARITPPIEATKWVRLLDAYRGPSWPVEEVALVESHLGEGPNRRPRHEVVATFSFS